MNDNEKKKPERKKWARRYLVIPAPREASFQQMTFPTEQKLIEAIKKGTVDEATDKIYHVGYCKECDVTRTTTSKIVNGKETKGDERIAVVERK